MLSGYDELKDCERLSIEIKPYKKKRSLDANAYFWVLLDRLSGKMGESKTKLYQSYIKDIGGNSETICVPNKAVERVRTGWAHNGIGWVTETMPSKLEGCTNIILYYGSSTYDSKQMSVLIDRAVQDCKAAGIETVSLNDIESMLKLWEKEEQK